VSERRTGPALRAAAVLLAVLAALAVATYLAGEQTEVIVLRTFDERGAPHDTRMWIVDQDGVPWVRVANPRRGWYLRLAANPRVQLVRGGATEERRARPDPSRAARRAGDDAFAAKYGWVDAWYGLLLRRDPIPIQLLPAEPAP
jgi:hypothetical protein